MWIPYLQEISLDIGQAASTLDHLVAIITSYRHGQVSCPDVTAEDINTLEEMKLNLSQLHQKWKTIFVWQDGPLVQAMKAGDLFLVDEISLADDSVLERLNSVLEPERKLVGNGYLIRNPVCVTFHQICLLHNFLMILSKPFSCC